MDAIVLAFTLKGQEPEKIIEQIKKVRAAHPNHILIHGFMPRKEVESKGWPTTILDALEENFPIRLNMYDGGPLREPMAVVASKLRANVLVIGEEKEGVAEEVKLYKQLGLSVYYYPIEESPTTN